MSENKNVTAVENENVNANENEITVKYILDQLEKIRKDKEHIESAIDNICEDEIYEEKANLIYDLAKSRENTNQRLITFYEKMYDDLTKEKEEKRNQKIRQVQEIWLSYLREVSSTIPFEDDIIETKNYVQSQISLLVMDIMDDKI